MPKEKKKAKSKNNMYPSESKMTEEKKRVKMKPSKIIKTM